MDAEAEAMVSGLRKKMDLQRHLKEMEVISLRKRCNELKEENEDLRDEIDDLKEEYAEHDKKVTELEGTIKTRDETIEDLNKQLADFKTVEKKLKQENDELNHSVAKLTVELEALKTQNQQLVEKYGKVWRGIIGQNSVEERRMSKDATNTLSLPFPAGGRRMSMIAKWYPIMVNVALIY